MEQNEIAVLINKHYHQGIDFKALHKLVAKDHGVSVPTKDFHEAYAEFIERKAHVKSRRIARKAYTRPTEDTE